MQSTGVERSMIKAYTHSLIDLVSSIVMGRFEWRPTSEDQLQAVEKKILSHVKTPYKGYFVKIDDNGNRLWTVQVDPLEDVSKDNLPLVMVHGFAAGSGIWTMNLDSLSSSRKVFSFDLLGFARSDRPKMPSAPDDVEQSFADSIEAWRKAVHLNGKFVLLGHSFGAYLALLYAMKYPDHISHLILCDPWGIAAPPANPSSFTPANRRQIPRWAIVTANFLFKSFSPLSALRAAGPYGPGLIQRMRPDIKAKFEVALGEDAPSVLEYIYHCNARTPATGELAFQSLSGRIGWALNPMIGRMKELSAKINLSFIYGSQSWVDKAPAYEIQKSLVDRNISIDVMEGAGHHVYADNVDEFNRLVNSICSTADDFGRGEG